jgi:hypothetical protein
MDVDPSFFNMIFTQSHSTNLQNDFINDPMIAPKWKEFNACSATMYRDWFNYWLKLAQTSNKMIYFFRFEDVLAQPKEELHKLFRFILGMETLEGTVIEKRIEEILAMGSEKNRAYKPRSGGSNKNY